MDNILEVHSLSLASTTYNALMYIKKKKQQQPQQAYTLVLLL